MHESPDDTIAALASAAGAGGRGIVRVSGPDCFSVLDRLFEPADRAAWREAASAHRHQGNLRLDRQAVALPSAVYFWPTRRSYTGEPLAEIHTVSSPPLLEELLSEIHAAGARPARPGEFTLRAFLSGRIDLVQAEAVLGVIDADDHRQLELALRQLAGGISGPLAQVRGDLLDLLADLEAGLDFVEEDISFVSGSETVARLEQARAVVERLLSQSDARMQSTGRRRVVLAGLPNAGKSTLFNALVGSDAAIVSEVRGTTRDYLRGEAEWQGLPVELIDTAGRELAAQEISHAAQMLAGEQLEQADLILWCTAANLDAAEAEADAMIVAELRERQKPLLCVRTKVDMADARDSSISSSKGDPGWPGLDRREAPDRESPEIYGTPILAVSAQTGDGLDDLRRTVALRLVDGGDVQNELLGSTASRCRESLTGTIESLARARQAGEQRAGDELVALELREALDHLARILGTVYTDDILDRVFSRFCIGK